MEAVEELLTGTDLVALLYSLPKRSAMKQIENWRHQKEQHQQICDLLLLLRRQITAAQAKRLDALDMFYETLCDIRRSCSSEEFRKVLFDKAVRSRVLREKLSAILDAKT